MYAIRLPISLIKELKKLSEKVGIAQTNIVKRGLELVMENPDLLEREPIILEKKKKGKISGFIKIRLPVLGIPVRKNKNKINFSIDKAKLKEET